MDQLLSTGGKIGVNLFVLITGYFLAKKFSKFSSLVYLWIKTFSYVIIFFLLFCALGLHPFSWSSLVSCFFPIRNDFYWFVSAYFLLILLSPFITIGIKALGQRKLFAFLLISPRSQLNRNITVQRFFGLFISFPGALSSGTT